MPLICARAADICLSALMVFSSTDRMARSAFAIIVKINTFFAMVAMRFANLPICSDTFDVDAAADCCFCM